MHESLAFLLLIDLTIGNNATADSATVSTYRVLSMQWCVLLDSKANLYNLSKILGRSR